jgi:hypothetical protein
MTPQEAMEAWVVFDDAGHPVAVSCASENDAWERANMQEGCPSHLSAYGHRCVKVTIKEVKMNNEEMNKLSVFICEHAMGWKQCAVIWDLGDDEFFVNPDGTVWVMDGWDKPARFNPPEDPAAAMAVLEKCAEKVSQERRTSLNVARVEVDGIWQVFAGISRMHPEFYAEAPTLPLAIAKFAQALFTPQTQGTK